MGFKSRDGFLKLKMERGKFLDFVIAGPDMSGTSTQINDLIGYFKRNNLVVRDLRGTEIDALFHAEIFKILNSRFSSISELPKHIQSYFFLKTYNLMSGGGD